MQDWRKIQVWLGFDWIQKLVFIKCSQMHWAKVQILLHAVGSFTLNQRKDCSRMIFCIMEGFFNQDHLEYWCICRQTETLGRLNKLDKLQICIYDFVCVISKQHIGLIAGLITQFMIITHWSKGLAVKVVDIFWVPKLLTFNFHGRILF